MAAGRDLVCVALLLVPTLLATPTATAGVVSCVYGDAPALYTLQKCRSVCTYNTGTETVLCDLDKGGGSDGYLYGATYYGSPEYSFWGYDDNGDIFCCAINSSAGGEIDTVEGRGSGGDDVLQFSSGTSWTIYDPGGAWDLDIYMYGELGGDLIYTPSDSSVDGCLVDSSNGDDAITLRVSCTAKGRAGGDSITGSEAADSIYGDAPGDPAGAFDGVDGISAGDGDDYVASGADDDHVCGDDGDDEMRGGADADRLWAGSGTDVAMGGAGYPDVCNAEYTSSCEGTLLSKPALCP